MSNNYRIFETEQFQRDIQDMIGVGQEKTVRKLRDIVYPQLSQHPHFGSNIKKLKSFSPETWRYRIGNWRFFYGIDDKEQIVFMIAASHRKDAY